MIGPQIAPLSILVRPATPDDLAFVSGDGHVPAERVSQMILDRRIYVATSGAERAGYARIEYLWSKVPYLAMIWVDDRLRRRGVGRAMVDAIQRDLRSAGHEFLYSSSQADEPAPQAWHRHLGFAECGFIAGINRGGIGEIFFRIATAR